MDDDPEAAADETDKVESTETASSAPRVDRKRTASPTDNASGASSAKRPKRDGAVADASSTSTLISEADVLNALVISGGRMKIHELLNRFKRPLKKEPRNKELLKTIMCKLVDMHDDALEGKILLLKPQFASRVG